MRKTIILMVFLICWPFQIISAETIYIWTDKDGIQNFSNTPPPDGVTDYQTKISEPSGTGNQRRSSYDQMVESASRQADAAREQSEKEAAEKAAEKARQAEKQRQAHIQTERKRLEQQIEALRQRAVSPTFPNGMKQAHIQALTKEIEKLEKPQANPTEKNEKTDR